MRVPWIVSYELVCLFAPWAGRARARPLKLKQPKQNHIESSYVHKRHKEKWMIFMLWWQTIAPTFFPSLSFTVCVCVSQSLLALYVNKIHACELVECFWSDWILLCRCRHYVEKESERERKMRIPKYNEMLFMSLFACDCVCVCGAFGLRRLKSAFYCQLNGRTILLFCG